MSTYTEMLAKSYGSYDLALKYLGVRRLLIWLTVVYIVVAAAGVGYCFFKMSVQPPVKQRATIVYKIYTPGYKYTMRAQTGARTVTMPAWQPDVCQLVIYVHRQPTDTVLTVTVPASTFTRYKVCDTINFNK